MADSATSGTRSVEIPVSNHEVITLELDELEDDPTALIDVLKDGKCAGSIWTRIAAEYWRKGKVDGAEAVSQAGITSCGDTGAALLPLHAILANINIIRAGKAPKIILPDAREDDMSGQKTKEQLTQVAGMHVNAVTQIFSSGGVDDSQKPLGLLSFAIQQLATRAFDDAIKSFQTVLDLQPTNIVALLGKARVLYTQRNYSGALKVFQEVLKRSPGCKPDPRIGIGLCLWAMEYKSKAIVAWQRALDLDSDNWPARLLLGLECLNASKVENQTQERMAHLLTTGTRHIEKAFNANQKSAAAANALSELFLRKGQYKRALKLAERTIQCADTLTVFTDGSVRAARAFHLEGDVSMASVRYADAIKGQPKHILAGIGLAQTQLHNNEIPGAIHTLDAILQPPNAQKSYEVSVMLVSLLSTPRPGVATAEALQEKLKARAHFDFVRKGLEAEENKFALQNGNQSFSRAASRIREDLDMHIEVARLWQGEDTGRAIKALREALRISQSTGTVDSRILNNLGALEHMDGQLEQARTMYEIALTSAAGLGPESGEGVITTVLYNLARVYEDNGEETLSKEAYDKLLDRHPEYVDAKIRLAQLLLNGARNNEAHELIKQALQSQSQNLNLRAYYTYFLIATNGLKAGKEFVFATLKDYAKYDIYSLCACGWIMYQQARESRDVSTKGTEERKRSFRRSAECYEKVLSLDPLCAIAAQGLAIATAEDALGSLVGPQGPDDAQKRLQNARDALDVFAKIRESVNEGSVYCNMGHCYYARDEFDRAIESYETASERFFNNQNIPVLLCLCRTWYAKANKDSSIIAMNKSLQYAQKALHSQPHDKAIMYNIAMIQQKAAEMLFGVAPAKRTLHALQRAIDQAAHAQKLFASLALDPSSQLPYNREIADQRRKYGDSSIMRKGDEQLAAQRQYEMEAHAKLESARRKRREEKEHLEGMERERLEELRRQAEALTVERKLAREQALEWTREVKADSDEERERKPRKSKKVKVEAGNEENVEPTKKRRSKKKVPELPDEEEAVYSDQENGFDPNQKRTNKRVIREEDEEDTLTAAPRKRTHIYKSKETISESDEEMS